MKYPYLEASAYISLDEKYRYRLVRKWAESDKKPLLWIMLNPSSADGAEDDPTIRRIREFSKRWGYGSMMVGNLFAYRATDPCDMMRLAADEAHGPENESHVWAMSGLCDRVVVAWGNPGGRNIPFVIRTTGGIWCLGKTKSGAPKHPLYLPRDTQLERLI